MKSVQKEIYLDILKHMEDYGFKLYKGKIWKCDLSIGYVISIEVELTRWGTLNDINVCASSFQSPIKLNKFKKNNEPLPTTVLKACLLYRRHEGINVFSMGNPYQSVDITLRQQYDLLRDYMEKNIYPLLMFDTDIHTYLQNMEKIQIKACDAITGVQGVEEMSLALEYYRYNDVESAMRIINLYTVYWDARIKMFQAASKHLPLDRQKEILDNFEQEKGKASSFAEIIKSDEKNVRRMIEENRTVSEQNCRSFFTSRFFGR